MCYSIGMDEIDHSSYREKQGSPLDDYEIPKMLPRIASGLIDLAIYLLLSFIILTIGGLFVGHFNQDFISANALINDHITYSKLAKEDENNGFVAYTREDYLIYEDDNPMIINQVAYFYLSYLTGENVAANFEPSLDKDEPIIIDGVSYLPKDYYDITFFNTNILKMEEEGATFFNYQKDEGVININKIALLDEQFLEEVVVDGQSVIRVVNNATLLAFLDEIYQEAIKVFYSQKALVRANKIIDNNNIILLFVSSIPSFIIIYLLMPLLSPFGKSIGKYLFSLAVVDRFGYQVQKWRLLLRSVPVLAVTIYVCLVPSLYYQLSVTILLLLISLGVLVFTPNRKALHDLMAGTTVIKMERGTIIYPDAEKYQEALEIIKQRKENKNV